jgi:REP element-mobilizing transposase RayT
LFGQIADAEMRLSDIGLTIQKCWNDIPSHFPNVVLREFIIMPNHIHGIIKIIKSNAPATNPNSVGARFIAPVCPAPNNVTAPVCPAPTQTTAPMCPAPDNIVSPIPPIPGNAGTVGENVVPEKPAAGGFSGAKNPMLHTDLARVIRWYKGRTTFECRETRNVHIWQRNYYEHIIRNINDYFYIARYINANPVEWRKDRFYNERNTV